VDESLQAIINYAFPIPEAKGFETSNPAALEFRDRQTLLVLSLPL
jgi:hypothetical protein